MLKDYTHLIFILDESGSMFTTQERTKKAVNDFFRDQQKEKEKCTYSLFTFNDTIHTVASFSPLPSFEPLTGATYRPQNNTALLDAVGYGIESVGRHLSALKEEERPSKVICVIFTDGMENASREYSREKIRALIHQQKETYSWEFIFMGSGEETWKQAGDMGISGIHTQTYAFNHGNAASAGTTYRSVGDTVRQARRGTILTGTHEEH